MGKAASGGTHILLIIGLCTVFNRLGFPLHTADNLRVITLYNRIFEKLIISQLVNKFCVSFANKTLITESTGPDHTLP